MKTLKRINAICEEIYPYKSIADIGCDHGYLIKLAIDNLSIDRALAIDNKIGPLNKAKENLKGYKNVEFILSDGLDKVDDNIDVVIIAGMDGNLIKDILNNNSHKLNNFKRIIIQANKDEYEVRKYLYQEKFKITNERIILEDDKIYEIDVFEHNLDNIIYDDDQLYFGPVFMNKKPELFINKWKNKYEKLNKIETYHTDPTKNKILERMKRIYED